MRGLSFTGLGKYQRRDITTEIKNPGQTDHCAVARGGQSLYVRPHLGQGHTRVAENEKRPYLRFSSSASAKSGSILIEALIGIFHLSAGILALIGLQASHKKFLGAPFGQKRHCMPTAGRQMWIGDKIGLPRLSGSGNCGSGGVGYQAWCRKVVMESRTAKESRLLYRYPARHRPLLRLLRKFRDYYHWAATLPAKSEHQYQTVTQIN
jgi:hypothetical protein